MGGVKQVVVVRSDLKMGKGKLAAQVAHASVSAMLEAERMDENVVREWLTEGQPKIVLKVGGLEELEAVYERARSSGLPVVIVVDKGLTQLKPGTPTCVGIGPAPSDKIDEITGGLKLL